MVRSGVGSGVDGVGDANAAADDDGVSVWRSLGGRGGSASGGVDRSVCCWSFADATIAAQLMST